MRIKYPLALLFGFFSLIIDVVLNHISFTVPIPEGEKDILLILMLIASLVLIGFSVESKEDK